MTVKNATLKLKLKLFHYTGSEADAKFLSRQFNVVASDYDIDWASKDHKVKPFITTVNYGRTMIEKGDYLLYIDDDCKSAKYLLQYADGPILLAPDDWSQDDVSFDPDDVTLEKLIDNGVLQIGGKSDGR